MIDYNRELQALVCDVCQEAVELKRTTAGAPETLFLLREEMGRVHRACEQFKDDPERARREREFNQRLERELLKAQRRAA